MERKASFCVPIGTVGKALITVPGLFLDRSKGGTMSTTLYTTSQAADYLQLATSTLEHWRLAGRGPAFVRIGKQVRYRFQDIEAFLNQQLVRA